MKKSSAATSCGLQVAVRVRPLNSREKQNPAVTLALDTGDNYVTVKHGNSNNEQETIYAFDSVFGVDSRTADLFARVAEPIVESSMSGVNGTIFAYGQTSSGKTFTMQGSEQEPGILRLAAAKLFAPNAKWSFAISVTYIELYNERVKDLLTTPTSNSSNGSNRPPLLGQEEAELKIREDPTRGFFVEGMVERPVSTIAELMACFMDGEKKRHVAGTDMNEKSSRSHTIFAIHITAKPSTNSGGGGEYCAGGLFKSKLSLVDLAGSESGRSTNAEGERLKEGGQINKSLLTLSMVISSLASASSSSSSTSRSHVKFRDSKLTQILQPSLVGNCMTAVVCCVTPASTFVAETTSTLKFANSAKQLKTEFVVNQIVDANMRTAKTFQSEISALEQQLQREKEQAKQREDELQRQVEEQANLAQQSKLLLDSSRRELELTKLAQSQVEQQVSSSANAQLEQLAQRSADDLRQLTLQFEHEMQARKQAESVLRGKLRELDEELQEQNQVVCDLTSELEDSTTKMDVMNSELQTSNSSAYEWKQVAEEHLKRQRCCETRIGELELANSKFASRTKELEALVADKTALLDKAASDWQHELESSRRQQEAKQIAFAAQLSLAQQERDEAGVEAERKSKAMVHAAERRAREEEQAVVAAVRTELAACEQRALALDQALAMERDASRRWQAEAGEASTAVVVLKSELSRATAQSEARIGELQRELAQREEAVQRGQAHAQDAATVLQGELASTKERVLDEQRMVAQLERLLEEHVQAEATNAEAANAALEAKLGEFAKTTAKWKSEAEHGAEKLVGLERELAARVKQLAGAEESLHDRQTEIHSLQQQLAASSAESASLTSQIHELQAEAERAASLASAELQEMREADAQAHQLVLDEHVRAAETAMAKANEETARMQHALSSTQAEIKRLVQEASRATESAAQQNEVVRQLQDQVQQSAAAVSALQLNLASSGEAAHKECEQLRAQVEAAENKLAVVERQRDDIDVALSAVKTELVRAEEQAVCAVEEAQRAADELLLEQRARDEAEHQSKVELVQQESAAALASARDEYLQLQRDAADEAKRAREALVTAAQQELDAVQRAHTERLTALASTGESAQQECARLQAQLDVSASHVHALEQDLALVSRREAELRGEMDLARAGAGEAAGLWEKERAEAAQARDGLASELERAQHAAQELQHTLEAAQREAAKQQAEMQTAASRLEQDVRQLQARVANGEAEAASLTTALSAKQHALDSLSSSAQLANADQTQRMAALECELAEVSRREQLAQGNAASLQLAVNAMYLELGAREQELECAVAHVKQQAHSALDEVNGNHSRLLLQREHEWRAQFGAAEGKLAESHRVALGLAEQVDGLRVDGAAVVEQHQQALLERDSARVELANAQRMMQDGDAALGQTRAMADQHTRALQADLAALHQAREVERGEWQLVVNELSLAKWAERADVECSAANELQTVRGGMEQQFNAELAARVAEEQRLAAAHAEQLQGQVQALSSALELERAAFEAKTEEADVRRGQLEDGLLAASAALAEERARLSAKEKQVEDVERELRLLAQERGNLSAETEHVRVKLEGDLFAVKAALEQERAAFEAKTGQAQEAHTRLETELQQTAATLAEERRLFAQKEEQAEAERAQLERDVAVGAGALAEERIVFQAKLEEAAELQAAAATARLLEQERARHQAECEDRSQSEAVEVTIAHLQLGINCLQLELDAVREENAFAGQELLEWARVDADRVLWERTCQLDEENAATQAKLVRAEQGRDEADMALQTRNTLVKCLEVELAQLELSRQELRQQADRDRTVLTERETELEAVLRERMAQAERETELRQQADREQTAWAERETELEAVVRELQHAMNEQQGIVHAVEQECATLVEQERAQMADVQHQLDQLRRVVASTATTSATNTVVVDDKLLRQRDDALAEMKAAFAHMKRSKNYWIGRLQVEINEQMLDAEMRRLEDAHAAGAAAPPAPASASAVLTEHQDKRARLSLPDDEEDVENRPVAATDDAAAAAQLLAKLCKLVDASSTTDLDVHVNSALKRLEGEILLLRERNAKLERAKLTQAQADQINQLKRDYLALKKEVALSKPATEESIAKYEEQCAEAIRTRDDALSRLRRMVEQNQAQEAAAHEATKFEIQRLERENLMLYKRVRELGGFPNM